MNNWWVYIIQCRNKSLYTGITTDVKRRFDEHQNNNKKASKYCARLRPLKLVYKSLKILPQVGPSPKRFLLH